MSKASTIRPKVLAVLDKLRLSLNLKPFAAPARIHRREMMHPTEKTAIIAQRTSAAAKCWGLYFSEMQHRTASTGSLQDSAVDIIRPAENNAVFSAVDVPVTDNFLDNESSQGMNVTV